MRHRTKSVKLGRTSQHRDAMLANLVLSLIKHNRVKTTLAKAKAAAPIAEKMITLGKKGDLHHRRLAMARLKVRNNPDAKQKGSFDALQRLFVELAPRYKDRSGGYTRILKLGPRNSDSAPMALLEWVDGPVAEAAPAEEVSEAVAEKE